MSGRPDDPILSEIEPWQVLEPENPDAVTITAKHVRDGQHEQQKRRQTSEPGLGSGTKTSVWSTIAPTIIESSLNLKFRCSIFSYKGALNKPLPNSNIIVYYRTRHGDVQKHPVRLNATNVNDTVMRSVIEQERKKVRDNKTHIVDKFFKRETVSQRIVPQAPHRAIVISPPISRAPAGSTASNAIDSVADVIRQKPAAKLLQSVALALHSSATGSAMSQAAPPLLQGLVDICGEMVQHFSEHALEIVLLQVYRALRQIVQKSATKALKGCVTFDCWSAALKTPI